MLRRTAACAQARSRPSSCLSRSGRLDVVDLAHREVDADRIDLRDRGQQRRPVLPDQVADAHRARARRRPTTGERISVYERLSSAWRSCAVAGLHLVLGVARRGLGVLELLLAHDLGRAQVGRARSSSALLCAAAVSARATAALAESERDLVLQSDRS